MKGDREMDVETLESYLVKSTIEEQIEDKDFKGW